jgi:hypothetical protein
MRPQDVGRNLQLHANDDLWRKEKREWVCAETEWKRQEESIGTGRNRVGYYNFEDDLLAAGGTMNFDSIQTENFMISHLISTMSVWHQP